MTDLDLLVLGSGVAGLSAAVRAADVHGLRVGLLTKGELHQATTRWAQGGVAAVLGGDPDSADVHLADTLAAGAGLCDPAAVRVVVDEGPARVHELIALGAIFDRDAAGALALAREGGHSHARVVHAGGAATGAEVERALVAAVQDYHEAYPHGLLAHSLSVAEAVNAAAAAFNGPLDRDLAVTGALIHDIGKTQAYNSDPLAIDLTDAGRLQGEIPLGYYLVRRHIEAIEGFDREVAQGLLHIVLSHHGALEHGSPVVPATREATLVHAMDNLGGKLGSFDRLERELPDGEPWSKFDRGIDSAAYFSARRAA